MGNNLISGIITAEIKGSREKKGEIAMAKIGDDFPQTRTARKEKLLGILKDKPVGSIKIPGKGRKDVYRIPLQFLSYNPHNTRFLAQAKTLEKRLGRKLSDETSEDVIEIEEFLWKQKQDENEYTINSLIEDGQLQPGVVTIDGIILSGNRRFRLLNEVSRNPDKYNKPGVNIDGLDYFEAAILEEELDEKGIVKFESFYQYGTEDKVEYDPIQKYIAADDQKSLGYTTQQIADHFMAITKGKDGEVKKWLEVFDLMEEYLDYIDEAGIYTALESREEAFLRLRSDLRSFTNGKAGGKIWAYKDNDLVQLKLRYFDFIRLNVPTHDVRIFKQIFSDEHGWRKFNGEVEEAVEKHNVVSFEEYREKYEDEEEAEISKIRNRDFVASAGKELKQIFGDENRKIVAAEGYETPIKILEQIQQKLDKLEEEIKSKHGHEAYSSEEFLATIIDIQKRVGRIKQDID